MRPLLRVGETAWSIEQVDRAGIIVDGKNYYDAFFAACLRAEKFIFISGWQFDSRVELVRDRSPAELGADENHATSLLAFLNDLCVAKPDLHVYILAWDFSVIYSLEREWLQKLSFDFAAHERVHFTFDACIHAGASHHQKYSIVDGEIAFVGSMDLCEHRWDERSHLAHNPLRTMADGTGYGPYHEVMTYLVGGAARLLVSYFAERWQCAAKTECVLGERSAPFEVPAMEALAMPAREVGLSRTQLAPHGTEAHEVRELFTELILNAERHIYVETQYFSSRAVAQALETRFRDTSKPKLEVVMVLPPEPDGTKEAIAIGVAQSKITARLRAVARATGNRLGLYVTMSRDGDVAIPTYVHSKLLIVDDRVLTLGSANLNNRSMGLDTELNVTFEATDHDIALRRAIRRLRVSLMAEHAGVHGFARVRDFVNVDGIVDRCDTLAADPASRLESAEMINPADADLFIDIVASSIGEYLDPEEAIVDDALAAASETWKAVFARGISRLRVRLLEKEATPTGDA